MEQFSLEKYNKNPNRKVITRDGRNVRIVCTDMIGTSYPILAICRIDGTRDCYYPYKIDGKISINIDSPLDLFFAPEKHEGWINLYQMDYGVYANSDVYPTKEEAERYGKFSSHASYVDTCKIEWEE